MPDVVADTLRVGGYFANASTGLDAEGVAYCKPGKQNPERL